MGGADLFGTWGGGSITGEWPNVKSETFTITRTLPQREARKWLNEDEARHLFGLPSKRPADYVPE